MGMDLVKRIHMLLAALFLVAGLLAGCGSKDEPKNESVEPKTTDEAKETGFPITIKDGVDKEVTIEKKPERIVSLIPSNTEIVYAIGAGNEVVGVNENDDYPEEAAKKKRLPEWS